MFSLQFSHSNVLFYASDNMVTDTKCSFGHFKYFKCKRNESQKNKTLRIVSPQKSIDIGSCPLFLNLHLIILTWHGLSRDHDVILYVQVK